MDKQKVGEQKVRVVTSVSCVIDKTVEEVYKKTFNWSNSQNGSLWSKRHQTKNW